MSNTPQRSWIDSDNRAYVIVRDADHGLSLMRMAKLRIDHASQRAALVGEVHEGAFFSIWTPVPFEVAKQMAARLHHLPEQNVGDKQGGRLGWRDAGYDGDVADWYCHVQ